MGSSLSNINKVAGTEFQTFHVRHEVASGVTGGPLTAGTWVTRNLNTVVTNDVPGASLSANQITLPAGTYLVRGKGHGYITNNHKIRLRNITSSTTIIIGDAGLAHTTSSSSNIATLEGKIVLTVETILELQHWAAVTSSGFGQGTVPGSGENEVHGEITFLREVSALSIANIEPANLTSLIRATFEDVEIKNLTSSTISIESGRVGSDDGAIIMEITSPITVDITASGENGLDTGSEAVSTWYYVYAIRNPSTGTIKGLLSISPTSPTLPAGFTQKARISILYNDSASDIYDYIQRDDEVWYASARSALSGGTATSKTLVSLSAYVPPEANNARLTIQGSWGAATTSGTQSLKVAPTSSGTTHTLRANYRRLAGGDLFNNTAAGEMPLFTPQSVWYFNSTSVTGSAVIQVTGFKFDR